MMTFAWMRAGLSKKGSPQHIPDIHLRCAVLVHLKHNYNAPCF